MILILDHLDLIYLKKKKNQIIFCDLVTLQYFLRSSNSAGVCQLILRVVILICLLYFVTVLFSVPHKKSTLKIRIFFSKNDSQKGDFEAKNDL
jgi:hypothetical protein